MNLVRFIFITVGAQLIYKGWYMFSHNMSLFFRGTLLKPSHGFVAIIVGLLLIYKAIRFSSDRGLGFKETYYKCPKCKRVYRNLQKNALICQDCQCKLENLEGYFERHLEGKNNSDLPR